jgi:hypothetical protein
MDTQKKVSWEVWATRLVSAASILALAYFLLFVDFSNHGSMWDKLVARVPVLAKIIPPASQDSTTMVVKGGAGMDKAASADRTLIVSEPAPEQTAPPPAAAPVAAPAVAAAPAQTAAKPSLVPHLTTSLSPVDIGDNNVRKTIPGFQPMGEQQAAPAAVAASSATAAAQSQNAPDPAIAAKANYGSASRSEIMGQAAGPVYNLTGRKK